MSNSNKKQKEVTELDVLKNIEKRLDAIISLLLNPALSEDTDSKKIEYLTKMSFSNDEIAQILNTTKNSVEAQKYKKPKPKKDLEKSKKT